MQGKLLDELNTRLKPFTEGAKQAATSWAVAKSNIEETFQVFSSEITEGLFDKLKAAANDILGGVFDTKNLGINEKYSAIVGVFKSIFTGVGTVVADSLKGGMSLLERINGWLEENKDVITEWKQGFSEIWVAVKGMFGTIIDIVGEWSVYTTVISVTLKTIALLVAGLADGFRVIGAAVIWVGGWIVDAISVPIQGILNASGDLLNALHEGWGDWANDTAIAVGKVGEKVRGVAGDLIKPVADGTGAVAKLRAAFDDVGTSADKAGSKTKAAAGAVVDSAKNVNKNVNKPAIGFSAQGAVAKAEAEVAVAAAKDALDRESKNLDYALSQQLISIHDYYAKKKEEQEKANQQIRQ
jgi:hypothetical protein